MNLLTSLCRRHAAARRPDAALRSGSARGLLSFFFRPHFAPARRHHSTRSHSRWHHDNHPWNFAASTAALLTAGGAAAIAAGHGSCYTLETIPYTNRTHLVFRTPRQELEHGESRVA